MSLRSLVLDCGVWGHTHTCGALKVRNKVNIISKLGNKKAHLKIKHLQDLYIIVLSQPARTRVLAVENLDHALGLSSFGTFPQCKYSARVLSVVNVGYYLCLWLFCVSLCDNFSGSHFSHRVEFLNCTSWLISYLTIFLAIVKFTQQYISGSENV